MAITIGRQFFFIFVAFTVVLTSCATMTPRGKLVSAAALGDYVQTKALLSEGVSPNLFALGFPGSRYNGSFTPLMAASNNGHYEVVELLISAGADVNLVDSHGTSALHFAAGEGHLNVAGLLLDHGALVDIPCRESVCSSPHSTPLLTAAWRGQYDVAELLIARGANLEATGVRRSAGWTALHFAASFGDLRLTKLLVEKGANVNATTDGGFSPLDRSTGEVARFLIDHGAKSCLGERH